MRKKREGEDEEEKEGEEIERGNQEGNMIRK